MGDAELAGKYGRGGPRGAAKKPPLLAAEANNGASVDTCVGPKRIPPGLPSGGERTRQMSDEVALETGR